MKWLKKILNSIFPDKFSCIICDGELSEKSRLGCCQSCLDKLKMNNENRCLRCSSPLFDESEYCYTCQNTKRYFDKAVAPLHYSGLAKQLVAKFKFDDGRYLAPYLASFMVDEFISSNLESDIIVYVPSHIKNLKKRGYNQAELLAVEVSKKLKLQLANCLIKTKFTQSQHILPKNERLKNLENSFEVTDKSQLTNKNVLIIDDVLTTGATASELACTIYKCKPKRVDVLCFAVTPHFMLTESAFDKKLTNKQFKNKFGKKK